MKNKLYYLVFFLIIAIAALVRFYGLEKSPPSLGFDEASLGYNAYSIMKTGRDEYGNWLPLSLRSFNDYKPALYAYLTIPFIKMFGLNDSSVRMLSALAGTISLIFLFLLLKEFIKSKWWRMAILFILSFEPWRLHYSRNAFESHLSSCFFTIGAWFLLKARKDKKKWWGAILFLTLSAYSYHSARLAVPLLLIFCFLDPIRVFTRKKILKALKKRVANNWKILLWLGVFLLLCVPIFMANNTTLLLTRFNQENLFRRLYPYTPNGWVNPLSIVYYFLGIVSGHVFANISPINLTQRIYEWVKMSPQFIPGMGMLGWFEGIVFVFGFGWIVRNILKSDKYRILIYWIVAGAAPAAATWTWFHPLRSLNIYPALEIIVAIGLVKLVKSFKPNKIFLIFGWVVILATIVFTINNELLYSAFENYGEYQPGGFKEGMSYLKSIQDNYTKVIIDSPHSQNFVFLFFYEALDPKLIQSYASIRPKPGTEGNLDFNFDKFIFRKVDWPKDKNLKKTVFWASSSVTDQEVERVPGAKIRMKVNNVLYPTAEIITTE